MILDSESSYLSGSDRNFSNLEDIEQYRFIENLINLTRISRKTVKIVLDTLLLQGLISEHSSFEDARKKLYYLIQSDWF